VVTGEGGHFCSGVDLRERIALPAPERHRHDRAVARALLALARFPAPTVAAVEGSCLGGGCELALACDLRIASETAVFGFPEVRLGVFPSAGGSQRLPALVGAGVARELIFTGR